MSTAILIQCGTERGQVFHDRFTVGRHPTAMLRVADEFVSPMHAMVYPYDDCWYVTDLGSMNGTYIGYLRVQSPYPLGKGTRIRLGHSVFTVVPIDGTVWNA